MKRLPFGYLCALALSSIFGTSGMVDVETGINGSELT